MKRLLSKKLLLVFSLLIIIISCYFYFDINFSVQAQEKPLISGDIFSETNVSGLSVDEHSVITAGGTIAVNSDAIWQIPNYTPSALIKLASFMNKMNTNITRLEKEYANPINAAELQNNTNIYLNTNNPNITTPATNINYKPEGRVWSIESGSVTIDSELTVHGIGTIIIKDGDLNINANIAYPFDEKSSLGFIIKNGKLVVGTEVYNLYGAYYVPKGEINFPLVGNSPWGIRMFTGLFIGNNIIFRQ